MRIGIPLAAAACALWLAAQQDTPEAQKNPLAGDNAAIAGGRALFQQACQACHGDEARGDRAPALTGALRRGSSDGEIFVNIRTGIRGSQMPPFAKLSADEVW